MRLRILFFLICTCLSFKSFSQSGREQQQDSIRAQYIEDFPNHFAIWPHTKYRDLGFRISDKGGDESSIKLNPNNTLKLGGGFYLLDLSFEVAFPISQRFRDESIYGETKAIDLQANILTKSLGVDLYFQKYSGFSKDVKDVNIPPGEPYPFRPDIDTRNLGGSAFYIWNNNKFSMRSSYNYADRQKKSAGSFIMYSTLNSFTVTGDSAIISSSLQDNYGEGSDFTKLRTFTFGLAPGYSYTLVIKGFFVNGTVAFGPAHNWIYIVSENGEVYHDNSFNTVYTGRIAAGYNSQRFFTGASFGLQSRVASYENIRITNSTSVFRLAAGYRFREKGFMKKHFWDFFKKRS